MLVAIDEYGRFKETIIHNSSILTTGSHYRQPDHRLEDQEERLKGIFVELLLHKDVSGTRAARLVISAGCV